MYCNSKKMALQYLSRLFGNDQFKYDDTDDDDDEEEDDDDDAEERTLGFPILAAHAISLPR